MSPSVDEPRGQVPQVLPAGESSLQDATERVDIAARENELGMHRQNEVACGTDTIAHNNRATAVHRFVDDDREGFIIPMAEPSGQRTCKPREAATD
jgi:hypothetical protein